MNKIKILSISIGVLVLLNLGLIFFILSNKPPRHPFRGGHRNEKMKDGPKIIIIDKLEFDEQQIGEYEKLIKIHQESINKLDEQLMQNKKLLYEQLINNNALKDSLMTALSQIQHQIEETHYSHFEALKKICKPNQQNKFNELTVELSSLFSNHKKHNK